MLSIPKLLFIIADFILKMQERIGKLFCLMNADGRLEEFADAAEKPELFEELFTEYGLESD